MLVHDRQWRFRSYSSVSLARNGRPVVIVVEIRRSLGVDAWVHDRRWRFGGHYRSPFARNEAPVAIVVEVG